jgi:hypothetical protein
VTPAAGPGRGPWWRAATRFAPGPRAPTPGLVLPTPRGPPGAVMGEGVEGGFAGVYPALRALEEAGRIRRGYFVDGLAGAVALPGADRLRALRTSLGAGGGARRVVHLLPPTRRTRTGPWPGRRATATDARSSAAGAYVVLDGAAVPYLDQAGRRSRRCWPGMRRRCCARAGRSGISAREHVREPSSARWTVSRSRPQPARRCLPPASCRGRGYAPAAAPVERPTRARHRCDRLPMLEGDTLVRVAAGLRPHLLGRTAPRRAPASRPQALRLVGRRSPRSRRRQEPADPVRQRLGGADPSPMHGSRQLPARRGGAGRQAVPGW